VLKLQLKNVVICGHSMGGQIAMTAVIRFPELFEKLILVNPAGFEIFTDEEIYWLKKYFTADIISAGDENQIRLNFKRNFYDMPDETEMMIGDRTKIARSKNFRNYCEVVANSFAGMLDLPVYDSLDDIKCETLILFGDKDDLIPHPYLHKDLTPEMVAKYGHENILGSELVIIPGCGHFMQFERPEEFNKYVARFISDEK
ncbi:MAG: alpha/beta fold hydrolase, partial [Syntrophothermus sp.]